MGNEGSREMSQEELNSSMTHKILLKMCRCKDSKFI